MICFGFAKDYHPLSPQKLSACPAVLNAECFLYLFMENPCKIIYTICFTAFLTFLPSVHIEKEIPTQELALGTFYILPTSLILTSKISNPAISRTPMKNCLGSLVSRVLLIRTTNHLNIRSYTALDKAPTAYKT